MSKIANDFEQMVLNVFTDGDRLTDIQVLERLNDSVNTLDEVQVVLVRLSSVGKLRLDDDDRWQLHHPDLSGRPQWATRTEFDHDGTVLGHEREFSRSRMVSVSLVEEVDPKKQLLSFVIDRWGVSFESPEEALDAANALADAANKWIEIQAGDDL